jgi:uncharacterized PurR-regulated membrane protein YhhQ (DUF165 family)
MFIGEENPMRIPFNKPSKESILSVKHLQKTSHELIENTPKQFIGYPVITVIMAVLQVFTVVFGSRGFLFFGFDITAGWLILMPINFYLFQIVAECYGWQYARQIVWLNFIVNLNMLVILYFFKYLPIDGNTHITTQNAYSTIFADRWIYAAIMLVSMLLVDYITSALMCWSKFHWKGKLLIFRIAILHCIAEIIINAGGFIIEPFHGYSFSESWKFAFDSFCARSIIMICLLPIVSIVIWWIQNRLEGVIVFDLNVRFAPFKFKINPNDSVQFIVQEWKMLPNIEKNQLNINKFAQEYFANHAVVKMRIHYENTI